MNHVYIATSLDGFIARSDGSLDWLLNLNTEPDNDYGFEEFLEGIDAILMGRKTFETVLNFDSWPFNLPVFVLSNTIKELPQELKNRVEIVNGTLNGIIDYLKSKGLINIYIDGGKTIRSFLEEDLIDSMIITTVPIILGEGISLFDEIEREIRFKCMKVQLINPYLIKHYYQRER